MRDARYWMETFRHESSLQPAAVTQAHRKLPMFYAASSYVSEKASKQMVLKICIRLSVSSAGLLGLMCMHFY